MRFLRAFVSFNTLNGAMHKRPKYIAYFNSHTKLIMKLFNFAQSKKENQKKECFVCGRFHI